MTIDSGSDWLARGLGVASLGLGVPLVANPRAVASAVDIAPEARQRVAMTAVGVRELAAAAALIARPHPAWLWGRVAGDVMDLGLLVTAVRNRSRRTLTAAAVVAGITALDAYAAVSRSLRTQEVEARGAVTVLKSADEVYEFWHRLENLSTFMAHVDEVRVVGPTTSHWRVQAPGGSVEWDAETVTDVPGECIAWRSTESAAIQNDGEVHFVPAPGGRGTEVHVRLRYAMPGGRIGRVVSRFSGQLPEQQLDDDLRRFKQVMETGEIVRSDGAPGGKRARREFPQHAARPLTREQLAEEVHA